MEPQIVAVYGCALSRVRHRPSSHGAVVDRRKCGQQARPAWSKKRLSDWVIYSAVAFAWIASVVYNAAVVFPTTSVTDGACNNYSIWKNQASKPRSRSTTHWDSLPVQLRNPHITYGRHREKKHLLTNLQRRQWQCWTILIIVGRRLIPLLTHSCSMSPLSATPILSLRT